MLDRIIARGDLPERDPRLEDFRAIQVESKDEIELRDSKVRDRRRSFAAARFGELTAEEAQEYKAQVEVLASVSEPEFADEQRAAAALAIDPSADPEDQKEARYKSNSWFIRQYELVKNNAAHFEEIVDKIDRIASIVRKLIDLLDKL